MSLSQIETQLEKHGYAVCVEKPLILGASLLHLVEREWVDGEGKAHNINALTLYRKGEMYILCSSRWDQITVEGRISLEDKKGEHSDNSVYFSSGEEAVPAGFGHILTVNRYDCVIRLWKKTNSPSVPDEEHKTA